jgi:hypothetical protein
MLSPLRSRVNRYFENFQKKYLSSVLLAMPQTLGLSMLLYFELKDNGI